MVKCKCGEATGGFCGWSGPQEETKIVEFMPRNLRDSHEAAGNRGLYPGNGAIRIRVEETCADAIVEGEDGWAFIVEEEEV